MPTSHTTKTQRFPCLTIGEDTESSRLRSSSGVEDRTDSTTDSGQSRTRTMSHPTHAKSLPPRPRTHADTHAQRTRRSWQGTISGRSRGWPHSFPSSGNTARNERWQETISGRWRDWPHDFHSSRHTARNECSITGKKGLLYSLVESKRPTTSRSALIPSGPRICGRCSSPFLLRSAHPIPRSPLDSHRGSIASTPRHTPFQDPSSTVLCRRAAKCPA